MSLADAGGLFGVLIILIAYAGAALGKLDPQRAMSLFVNFVGAEIDETDLKEAVVRVRDAAHARVQKAGLRSKATSSSTKRALEGA